MKDWEFANAKRRKAIHDRLKIAEVELTPLLVDVRRDRDRLAASSLKLRFVWQTEEHPYPGKLWELGYGSASNGYWSVAGYSFGRMLLPAFTGCTPYECNVYLVHGNDTVYERFTQHCREAEAVFGRMASDGARINWAEFLFNAFQDALHEDGLGAVDWRENEEPDRPETWSYVADLRDALGWTRLVLETFRDRAVLRQQTPDGRLPDDYESPSSTRKLKRPAGQLPASLDVTRSVYEWAMSTIPNADTMTTKELFNAIQTHPEMKSDFLERFPDNPDTFGTYLRRIGIRRYNKSGDRARRQSRRRRT